MSAFEGKADVDLRRFRRHGCPVSEKLMKSALTFIGFFLLAMGLFWAGQGADLIRWPAESFMVNARQWIYYGGGTAVIGLVLILLARR
jgi:uncharacterized membrane protein